MFQTAHSGCSACVRAALSATEKCELSFFGLQCTFASAAVRGKMERMMKSRGGQRDRAHLKLIGHPVTSPQGALDLLLSEKQTHNQHQRIWDDSRGHFSITYRFLYTYMGRKYCYFDTRVHQPGRRRLSLPNPATNTETGTKTHFACG